MSLKDNRKQARRWRRKATIAARRERHARVTMSLQGDVLQLLLAKLEPDALNSFARSK